MTTAVQIPAQPLWPLPLLVAVQVLLFRTFALFVEPGAPLVALALAGVPSLGMAVLAGRNLWRLARAKPVSASWATVVTLVLCLALVGLLAAAHLVENGPAWPDAVLAVACGAVAVLVVREVGRL